MLECKSGNKGDRVPRKLDSDGYSGNRCYPRLDKYQAVFSCDKRTVKLVYPLGE